MCDSWLVNSGASQNFSRYHELISNLVERETNLKIIFGDSSTYFVKGFGSVKFHLDYGETVLLHDVMYVPRLKKNLISIFVLEDKGLRVAFIREKVLTWPSKSHMRDTFTLESIIQGLYRVNGRPLRAMIHDSDHQSELWHQRFPHLHYETLPKVRRMVFGVPEVQTSHDGVCPGCTSGKKSRLCCTNLLGT